MKIGFTEFSLDCTVFALNCKTEKLKKKEKKNTIERKTIFEIT